MTREIDKEGEEWYPEDNLIETQMVEISDGEDGLAETAAITISDIAEKTEEKDSGDSETTPPRQAPRKKGRKLRPAARMFLRIVLVVSICTAAYSGFQLYLGNKTYREGMNAYAKLTEQTESAEQETIETESGETMLYTPADFASLSGINPDTVGWITLNDTVIDYPVVQGTDNEYYLEHLFTGETNHTGCVFLDMNNSKDFSDRNSVLYAHHMRNGSMFAEIENYRQAGYLETHPYLILQTPEGVYKVEPFADILGNGYSTYNRTSFDSDEEFLQFVSDIRAGSTFSSDMEITAQDRILTLSTCRYDAADGRYAVFGKLTRIS